MLSPINLIETGESTPISASVEMFKKKRSNLYGFLSELRQSVEKKSKFVKTLVIGSEIPNINDWDVKDALSDCCQLFLLISSATSNKY